MALLNKINVKGTEYPIVTDDGYYQEMSVGGAEQLISTVFVEDEVPYNFRTTGGSADVGNRKTEKIIGGTVEWNQHSDISDTTVTVAGNLYSTAQTAQYNKNHIYLFAADVVFAEQPSQEGGSQVYSQPVMIGLWQSLSPATYVRKQFAYASNGKYAAVVKGQNLSWGGTMEEGVGSQIIVQVFPNTGTSTSVKNIQVFDLTQMFGSTIADYIYSLEQANAGAGVAWFKKLFPKAHYAYDAGSLQSVKALRHITRGFNAFNKATAVDGKYINISKNAVNESTDATRGHSDYIPVVGGATYFCSCYAGSGYYAILALGANKEILDPQWYGGASWTSGNKLVTLPSEAHYVILNYYIEQKDEVCFNLSWDGERDGEYEAYEEHVYELDPDLELRGIPKLAQNGSLYYDGDEYESDGTVTRKYGIVDLGTLNWERKQHAGTGNYYFQSATIGDAKGDAPSLSVCAKYRMLTNTSYLADLNNYDGFTVYKSVYIRDDAYTDATAFKTAMNGVYLVYKLADSTTETADPYTNPQVIDDFGTEEYVDAGVAAATPTRDVAIPVGHFSEYMNNLRAKLEMAPDSPENDGYYVVYHHDGINEYTPLIIPNELPDLPTEDGTYTLKCTVLNAVATLSFEEVTE